MRILIADDEDISRLALSTMLVKRDHHVLSAADGRTAWNILNAPDPPRLAILDWQMPGVDGLEICRRLRANSELRTTHVILLTARGSKEDVVQGLSAGANDYMTKPFEPAELEARINVGIEMIRLREELAERVRELESALAQVNRLQGLLPMCSYCKRIRDDGDYWQRVETYIAQHSEATFSHGVCPECWDTVVRPELMSRGIPDPGEYA